MGDIFQIMTPMVAARNVFCLHFNRSLPEMVDKQYSHNVTLTANHTLMVTARGFFCHYFKTEVITLDD